MVIFTLTSLGLLSPSAFPGSLWAASGWQWQPECHIRSIWTRSNTKICQSAPGSQTWHVWIKKTKQKRRFAANLALMYLIVGIIHGGFNPGCYIKQNIWISAYLRHKGANRGTHFANPSAKSNPQGSGLCRKNLTGEKRKHISRPATQKPRIKGETPVVPVIRKYSRFAMTQNRRLWWWGSGLWQMCCVNTKTVRHQPFKYKESLKSKECRLTSWENHTSTWATRTEKTSGGKAPCSSFDQRGPVSKWAVSDLENKTNFNVKGFFLDLA